MAYTVGNKEKGSGGINLDRDSPMKRHQVEPTRFELQRELDNYEKNAAIAGQYIPFFFDALADALRQKLGELDHPITDARPPSDLEQA